MSAESFTSDQELQLVDADVRGAQRLSDRKALKMLGVVITREDGDADVGTEDDGRASSRAGFADDRDVDEDGDNATAEHVRGTLQQLFTQPRGYAALGESDGASVSAGTPLIAAKGVGRGKTKKRLGRMLGSLTTFRRRKGARQAAGTAARAVLPSVTAAGLAQDPFSDENAMECEAEDASGWTTLGGSDGEEVGVEGDVPWKATVGTPKTPERKRGSESGPTTPGASPKSRRSQRTPGSAKSWLSASSEASAMSSLYRKHVRKRGRTKLESQMKALQVLGSEAAGAVAKAGKMKETKLRYRMFDNQLTEWKRRT